MVGSQHCFMPRTIGIYTGCLAHAIDLHEWKVETHKEVECVLHNGRGGGQAHTTSVKAES